MISFPINKIHPITMYLMLLKEFLCLFLHYLNMPIFLQVVHNMKMINFSFDYINIIIFNFLLCFITQVLIFLITHLYDLIFNQQYDYYLKNRNSSFLLIFFFIQEFFNSHLKDLKYHLLKIERFLYSLIIFVSIIIKLIKLLLALLIFLFELILYYLQVKVNFRF